MDGVHDAGRQGMPGSRVATTAKTMPPAPSGPFVQHTALRALSRQSRVENQERSFVPDVNKCVLGARVPTVKPNYGDISARGIAIHGQYNQQEGDLIAKQHRVGTIHQLQYQCGGSSSSSARGTRAGAGTRTNIRTRAAGVDVDMKDAFFAGSTGAPIQDRSDYAKPKARYQDEEPIYLTSLRHHLFSAEVYP